MVSYVLSQKQSNHLGLTPAIGASPNFQPASKIFIGQQYFTLQAKYNKFK